MTARPAEVVELEGEAGRRTTPPNALAEPVVAPAAANRPARAGRQDAEYGARVIREVPRLGEVHDDSRSDAESPHGFPERSELDERA